MRAHYTVVEICEALDLSRSGYYKSIGSQPSERQRENGDLLKEMKVVHNEGFKRAYGSPRMTIELQRRGLSCSENRVARLMSKAGMKARYKTAFRPKTTVQNPARLPAPNRLSKAPAPVRPGEVLVSDITYVATTQGWMYLAVTLDLFSRQVAGWHLAQSMETALVIQAARKASSRAGVGQGTIYHSDRGCQYTSAAMRSWLKDRGIVQSMSAAGYCYDNAACESFFATLKREAFPANCVFSSKAEARRTIFEYIETFYNRIRIHTSLKNQSPHEYLTKHFQQEKITLNLNQSD
ncbi:MAG: IS3 family transposase [Verrucomicrobiales bacterium]